MLRHRKNRIAKATPTVLAMILLLAGAGCLAWFLIQKKDDLPLKPPVGTVSDLSMKQIEEVVRSIALLENNDFDSAIKVFEQILQDSPGNGPTSRNLAIAWLGKVEQLMKELEDRELRDKHPKILEELPGAIDAADEAALAAIRAQPDDAAGYQLATAIRRKRIQKTPLIADELRLDLVNLLREYTKRSPGNAALAIAFHDTAEELSFTYPDLKKEAIGPLLEASRKFPRNLYLMEQSARLLIEFRDDRIIDVMNSLVEAAKPYKAYISRTLYVDDADQLVQKASQDYKNGEHDSAEGDFIGWLNCLKGCPGFKPDERLVNPATLALIDLRDVEKAFLQDSTQSRLPESKVEPSQFIRTSWSGPDSGKPFRKTYWFDWNLDQRAEIVSVADDRLQVWEWKVSKEPPIELKAEIPLDAPIDGCAFIDLFEIMSQKRAVVPQKEREDAVKERSPGLSEDELNTILSRRQQTYRDLVLYGPAGVQIVTTKVEGTASGTPELVKNELPVGLEDLKQVTQVLPNDWDGDGDLDLLIVAEGKIRLRLNLGSRNFEDSTEYSEIPSNLPVIRAVLNCDFDRDMDADFLVSLDGGDGFGVLENLMHGQFRFRKLDSHWSTLSDATRLQVAELDGNVSWDFVAAGSNEIRILQTVTTEVGKITATSTRRLNGQASQMELADLNQDLWIDCIAGGERGLQVWWGQPGGGMANEPQWLVEDQPIRSISIGDADGNGNLELLVTHATGTMVLVTDPASNGDQTTIRLKGIDDANGGGRVNEYGIGSVIELYSPGRYQAAIVKDDATHFGLGKAGAAYNARIIFTNGLTQNVIEPKVNAIVEEKQVPKGSCPFLYAWDGSEIRFVTDCLWNAPLGLQVAPGVTIPDRRWEYLHIRHDALQPKDGMYELRVTEELWEAAYFDLIELTAVDHPADVQILTNEKVGPPSIAEPKIWEFPREEKIPQVVDQLGRDWTDALTTNDRRYAIPFDRRLCQGLVEPFYLEMDLGAFRDWPSIQLVLHGWIFPTDTSLNIGIHQNPQRPAPEPPSLWMVNASGEFECVQPMMGFPGGKPKSIVVDLTNKFLSDDHRIRIQTSNEIYWDSVQVVRSIPETRSTIQSCRLESAELHYRGFSKTIVSTRDQPHDFRYSECATRPQWLPMEGLFTRFGDVRSLLASDDDRMVVMGSGDEIILRFNKPDAELPSGWVRDFVMHNVGWDKDADLNTLQGQSSLPLPFAAQESYPAPGRQWKEVQRVWEWNREHLTREQLLRGFWNEQPKLEAH